MLVWYSNEAQDPYHHHVILITYFSLMFLNEISCSFILGSFSSCMPTRIVKDYFTFNVYHYCKVSFSAGYISASSGMCRKIDILTKVVFCLLMFFALSLTHHLIYNLSESILYRCNFVYFNSFLVLLVVILLFCIIFIF
jgi:hypothetical protein